MRCTKFLLSSLVLAAAALPAVAGPLFLPAASVDLRELESLALAASPAILATREQVAAAQAGVASASAFPNPEVEYLAGPARARVAGANPGDTSSLSLTQPLDLPHRRGPRIAAAEAARVAVEAGVQAFQAEVLARLRQRYFELLKREAELKTAREDAVLMEGVRSRIALRVATGEAPRFELIKADAEALNAQKFAQAAALRVEQARSLLRQTVGGALPANYSVRGRLEDVPPLPTIDVLRTEMLARNADLGRARAEAERASRQLDYERAQRWPHLALKATRDEDPDLRTSRVGMVISIPLWDRRSGPMAEAAAGLARARYELEAQEFSLQQTLEVAFQQYEIAQTQVTALESGIVHQAEAALRVAEAAYRFGERGFLEVLDAQRVYRAARNELITARFELASAWAEIERLRASDGDRLR